MKWEPNGKVDVRSPSFPNGALVANRSLSAPSPSPALLGFSVEISSFSFSCVFKVFSSQPVLMFFSFSLFFSLFFPFFFFQWLLFCQTGKFLLGKTQWTLKNSTITE
jgi:uncharacterized membrane protein